MNIRVWDIHPKHLCRKYLLAEHRELHGLWNILTKRHTPLDKKFAIGSGSQNAFINTVSEQKVILKQKPCDCLLH